jgi:hypothetical protein
MADVWVNGSTEPTHEDEMFHCEAGENTLCLCELCERKLHAMTLGMGIGGKQIRGNGALVLTKESLFFLRGVPYREYVVPLNRIMKITLPDSFNGRSVFAKLLYIEFKTDVQGENQVDAMAWAVKYPEEWKNSINRRST